MALEAVNEGATVSRLLMENERLRDENENLKDDLLALIQEPQDQASDGSLAEACKYLRYDIEFWVHNVIKDSNFKPGRAKLSSKEHKLRKDLGFDWPKAQDMTITAQVFLSVAIQKVIQDQIFDKLYPVGVTEQQAQVIDHILDGMQEVVTARDRVVREQWRSHAIGALIAHETFPRQESLALHRILQAAQSALSMKRSHKLICGISQQAFRDHYATFHQKIFVAAVDLHRDLRNSIKRYIIRLPGRFEYINSDRMKGEGWNLRDLDSWADLKGDIGTIRPICPLYPSIERESDGVRGGRMLVPPTVVVELVKEPVERSPSDQLSISSHSSLVTSDAGSMEEDGANHSNQSYQQTTKKLVEKRCSHSHRKVRRHQLGARSDRWIPRPLRQLLGSPKARPEQKKSRESDYYSAHRLDSGGCNSPKRTKQLGMTPSDNASQIRREYSHSAGPLCLERN